MSAIGSANYSVPVSGSITVAPGNGAVVAGTVLRLHIRNLGPGIVYVSANSSGASNGHVDSNPRGEQGFRLLPGEVVVINSEDANLDVTGNLTSRVSVLAEA